MEEHLLLEVGDVIQARKGLDVPPGIPLRIIGIEHGYEVDWPGKRPGMRVFLSQTGVDKYVKRLMPDA